MRRLGFIHDMMDVKVLILFVMGKVSYPVTCGEIYELCYQDECLSYFDVCTAIPEMVKSGHLKELPEDRYEITDMGRHDGELTEDSIAFTVKQKAESAVASFNRKLRRSSFVKTRLVPRNDGTYSMIASLDDDSGSVMTLELFAPNQRQAAKLSELFEKRAEDVYSVIMMTLLDDAENSED